MFEVGQVLQNFHRRDVSTAPSGRTTNRQGSPTRLLTPKTARSYQVDFRMPKLKGAVAHHKTNTHARLTDTFFILFRFSVKTFNRRVINAAEKSFIESRRLQII